MKNNWNTMSEKAIWLSVSFSLKRGETKEEKILLLFILVLESDKSACIEKTLHAIYPMAETISKTKVPLMFVLDDEGG